jgi:hypothetical protein
VNLITVTRVIFSGGNLRVLSIPPLYLALKDGSESHGYKDQNTSIDENTIQRTCGVPETHSFVLAYAESEIRGETSCVRTSSQKTQGTKIFGVWRLQEQ